MQGPHITNVTEQSPSSEGDSKVFFQTRRSSYRSSPTGSASPGKALRWGSGTAGSRRSSTTRQSSGKEVGNTPPTALSYREDDESQPPKVAKCCKSTPLHLVRMLREISILAVLIVSPTATLSLRYIKYPEQDCPSEVDIWIHVFAGSCLLVFITMYCTRWGMNTREIHHKELGWPTFLLFWLPSFITTLFFAGLAVAGAIWYSSNLDLIRSDDVNDECKGLVNTALLPVVISALIVMLVEVPTLIVLHSAFSFFCKETGNKEISCTGCTNSNDKYEVQTTSTGSRLVKVNKAKVRPITDYSKLPPAKTLSELQKRHEKEFLELTKGLPKALYKALYPDEESQRTSNEVSHTEIHLLKEMSSDRRYRTHANRLLEFFSRSEEELKQMQRQLARQKSEKGKLSQSYWGRRSSTGSGMKGGVSANNESLSVGTGLGPASRTSRRASEFPSTSSRRLGQQLPHDASSSEAITWSTPNGQQHTPLLFASKQMSQRGQTSTSTKSPIQNGDIVSRRASSGKGSRRLSAYSNVSPSRRASQGRSRVGSTDTSHSNNAASAHQSPKRTSIAGGIDQRRVSLSNKSSRKVKRSSVASISSVYSTNGELPAPKRMFEQDEELETMYVENVKDTKPRRSSILWARAMK